jgi:hypothetical protein
MRHLQDRPAVWIDDVITPEARTWASARGIPTLLLEVDPAIGLSTETVELALQWAAQHTPA